MKPFQIEITKEQEGWKLKEVLAELGLSRRQITRLHQKQGILLNGKTCSFSTVLSGGDSLELFFTGENEAFGLLLSETADILYQEEGLLVVYKPAGIACHPAREHPEDNLGTILQKQLGTERLPAPVGRLDKDVSGLMVYALDKKTAAELSRQREEGTFEKEYTAIVKGTFLEKKGRLSFSLSKKYHRKKIGSGKECVTDYTVVKQANACTELQVKIITGRTHQIRAGMAGYGHPLAGDQLYGGDCQLLHRPALHCGTLRFLSPAAGEKMTFTVNLPEDLLVAEKKIFGEAI